MSVKTEQVERFKAVVGGVSGDLVISDGGAILLGGEHECWFGLHDDCGIGECAEGDSEPTGEFALGGRHSYRHQGAR